MSQPNSPAAPAVGPNLPISGGAAIIAPASAFAGGVPQNALIVVPMKKPTDELLEKLKSGAVALTPDQMWPLLGFNGPPVQVQDQEGRPISIGLEDLLSGLEKHWKENQSDLSRGRMYAQELMRHGRAEQAEKVLAKVVALGGSGEDWLALGVAQAAAGNIEKSESTLKGAQNLLPTNPFAPLNLAKVYAKQNKLTEARTLVEKALEVDANCVEAWVYLYSMVREASGEDKAIAEVEALADATTHKGSSAPYIALQGIYSSEPEGRPKALEFAKKAVDRNKEDVLALISLSALYGQAGDIDAAVNLLQDHEQKMLRDVRLANNYFEALLQSRKMERLTKLLNTLAGSPNKEVKQFAIERSRAVAQMLQQQRPQQAAPKA
ncbi:MAG TPA: tetratricopeptide repeat protein [Polyangiaceae bacterium]|jgi:tetratricopeptide (TPR) repeat protein|nr:tetratricopeptide repeat protein [Polyangiaceae bacterium]